MLFVRLILRFFSVLLRTINSWEEIIIFLMMIANSVWQRTCLLPLPFLARNISSIYLRFLFIVILFFHWHWLLLDNLRHLNRPTYPPWAAWHHLGNLLPCCFGCLWWQECHNYLLPWKSPAGQQSFLVLVKNDAGLCLHLKPLRFFILQPEDNLHMLLEESKRRWCMQFYHLNGCVEAHKPDKDIIIIIRQWSFISLHI